MLLRMSCRRGGEVAGAYNTAQLGQAAGMSWCVACLTGFASCRSSEHEGSLSGRAGALEDWPARTKWRSLAWWVAQHGARSVPVELGAGCAWREAVMTLGELVEGYLVPSARGEPEAEIAYLAQHALLDQVRAARGSRGGLRPCCHALRSWLGAPHGAWVLVRWMSW